MPGYSDDNVTVYVNRSAARWGPGAQDRVESFLLSKYEDLYPLVDNVTWTPGCDYALMELLCHATLPFCKSQGEWIKNSRVDALHVVKGEKLLRVRKG